MKDLSHCQVVSLFINLPVRLTKRREAATQMERPGFVLDNTNDVERIPGRYQTSQEWMAIVDKAVSFAAIVI